jgi:hypothetical protein
MNEPIVTSSDLIQHAKTACIDKLQRNSSLSKSAATEVVEMGWPQVRLIEEETLPGFSTYRVTIPKCANILSVVLGGDVNVELHLQHNALQTISLISACSAVVNVFRPRKRLVAIKPDVSFRAAVMAGVPMTFLIREATERSNRLYDVYELRGFNAQGKALFKGSRWLEALK